MQISMNMKASDSAEGDLAACLSDIAELRTISRNVADKIKRSFYSVYVNEAYYGFEYVDTALGVIAEVLEKHVLNDVD